MRYLALLLMTLSCALLVNPPEAESCGGFPPVAQFGYVYNPGPEFLKGQLGIVSPKYFRRNLVVAYRYLSGVPLSAEEAKALEPLPADSSFQALGRKQDAEELWLAARKQVPGAAAVDRIEVSRYTLREGIYRAYSNCLDDAFVTATDTLAARRQRWGSDGVLLAEWLRGQDAVFANCGGGAQAPWARQQATAATPPSPGPLAPGADALLEADRQYQVAAAAFYAGRFDESERAFRAVAANRNSPWRDSGAYMAARALIRRGTVDADRAALEAASKALDAILKDPAQKKYHASARGLQDFVRGQLSPEDRMVELGDALSKPGLGAGIRQAMIDYTMLWDRENKGPAQRSDLADWITAFQNGDRRRLGERWREGGGTQWLVGALAHAERLDSDTPELIAAARAIKPGAPGYPIAAYHGIRLQTALGQRDQARAWADEALAASLSVDAENALRGSRMALARNWSEFLKFAPRRTVASMTYAEWDDLSDISNQPLLDWDSAMAFNLKIPLQRWLDASSNKLLPANLQADIAGAGWVRSVVLNRETEARAFARRLSELRPELAPALQEYISAPAGESARFAAVWFMLHYPGLAPKVRQGFPRETKLDRIDDLRDNWWSFTEFSPEFRPDYFSIRYGQLAQHLDAAQADFLTEAQRSQGEREWAALLKTATSAPNYLCGVVLSWARTHPEDPRVPEALHLAVKSTRFGMTDDATTDFSRRAFQLLHSRYPKSEWAAKTKYWF